MPIITIANQKGGVGKTTTCMNLGVALARAGKSVLLIDSDPQANLTSYLGVEPGGEGFESLLTLDEMYLSKRPFGAEGRARFITSTSEGVSLIAADKNLAGVEYYLFQRPDREQTLARFLDPLSREYDFILIDTPPSMNLLTLNALCGSDGVIIPVQPEFFSLEGIVKVRAEIESIRERFNAKLMIYGVLPTQVNPRRKLTEEVLATLREAMPTEVFQSMIHENAKVAESSGHARSVIDYDSSSKGAKDYLRAADELLSRVSSQQEL